MPKVPEVRARGWESQHSRHSTPPRHSVLPALLIGYKAASDVVSKLALFAITVMAARALSAADFGVFAVAWTLGWLLGLATDMGLQVHLARSVSREPNRAGMWCRALLPARLAAAALASLTAVALSVLWLPGGRAAAFSLIAVAQICGSLIEFFNHVFRGLSRSDVESSVNLAHRLGVLLLAWPLLANGGGLESLAVALLVPAAVALVFVAQLALSGSEIGHRETGSSMSWSGFRRDVLPIGIGALLSALYFRVDLFLVQHWVGDGAAGLYNAVFRMVEALRLFPAAVLAVMFPQMCRARDARLLRSLSLKLAATGVALSAGVYWTAPAIVHLFYGPRYAGGSQAFRILAAALPLLFLNYALTTQLVAWNLQRAYAAMCGMMLAVNVGVNALWIPRFGIAGAAWATVATELGLTVACGVLLVQRAVGDRGVERGAVPLNGSLQQITAASASEPWEAAGVG
ncbi:MAG: oligosaccharide flippase family protein, partial [Acidobacteria bacterium]|nr:oligosaccharide flippase family protein [Acidobacteriota bacterium]